MFLQNFLISVFLPKHAVQSSQVTFSITSSSVFTIKVTEYFLLFTLCSGHIFALIVQIEDSQRKHT